MAAKGRHVAAFVAVGAVVTSAAVAFAQVSSVTRTALPVEWGRNAIFLHPDGTSIAHWTAARLAYSGPDGSLEWDKLSAPVVYRSHALDLASTTSNAGATMHAFGWKVEGTGSFGQDGGGSGARPIVALSGYPGSIMREAANAGHPVGIVNDGNVGEPGTAAFLAEVRDREDWNGLALQMIAGRDMPDSVGASSDRAPVVLLGGGERNFLPVGTPRCARTAAGSTNQAGLATFPLDCMVHDTEWGKARQSAEPARTDGRNLLAEAAAAGFLVIRTRTELEALTAELAADPTFTPRVLGLFAAHHLFNDRDEETLLRLGYKDASRPDDALGSNMILWGAKDTASPSFNPPTSAEMAELALEVLSRQSVSADKPFLLVQEVESTDNFSNGFNAAAMIRAVKSADDVLAVAKKWYPGGPNTRKTRFSTNLLVGADSVANGPVVNPQFPWLDADGRPILTNGDYTYSSTVSPARLNPADQTAAVSVPVDGAYGRGTRPFLSAPDQYGHRFAFGIAWATDRDSGAGVVARSGGRRTDLFVATFAERFDNTDVYRWLRFLLTGTAPAQQVGVVAPSR